LGIKCHADILLLLRNLAQFELRRLLRTLCRASKTGRSCRWRRLGSRSRQPASSTTARQWTSRPRRTAA